MPGLPDNSPLWLTILVLTFMGAMVFLQTRYSGTEKIGGAYNQLLTTMQKQIDELEADVKDLKKDLAKYRNWTARLIKQLSEHGIVPVDPPDTGELKGNL